MSKQNFKLRLRFSNELSPNNLLVDTTNEYIIYADNDKDCLSQALVLIKKIISKLNKWVITINLMEIGIYKLKESLPGTIETEAVFWCTSNNGLPLYDSEKIMSSFDEYMNRSKNS